MANFPFKNATFTSYADITYPVIEYGSVYYTKINGQIMAIKPKSFGIFKPKDNEASSWAKRMMVLAADGKTYNLDMCGRRLFLTADEAVAYEKRTLSFYKSPINEKHLDDVISRNGGHRDWHSLKVYAWGQKYGEAFVKDGGYIFWVDKDGEHIQFEETDKDGRKLYLNKADCVNDNVKVLDFSEDVPAPRGEYTVKREFTVKASSEEEAESIIDEAINKAYKEQFK